MLNTQDIECLSDRDMKTLIIGSSGTIGKAVVNELKDDTDIITANRHSGDYQVDITDASSIKQLFHQINQLDAIICVAARGVVFKPVRDMTLDDYHQSIHQKLLGQISIVLHGLDILNDKGSITLTTGMMNHDYVANGSAASMVNNAIEGFAKAAALDMPRGIRLNVVSPALLEESAEKYAHICPGFEPVSSQKVARCYRKSLYGIQNGQVFRVA